MGQAVTISFRVQPYNGPDLIQATFSDLHDLTSRQRDQVVDFLDGLFGVVENLSTECSFDLDGVVPAWKKAHRPPRKKRGSTLRRLAAAFVGLLLD